MQIAVDSLVDACCTGEIHDEWIRNLVADMPGIPIERLQTTRKLMNDALPDATVTGYRTNIEVVTLPIRMIAMSPPPRSRPARRLSSLGIYAISQQRN